MTKEIKPKRLSTTEEQTRYGHQWGERDKEQRQDRERQRSEPDYGDVFGH